jgi:hypothetical protein
MLNKYKQKRDNYLTRTVSLVWSSIVIEIRYGFSTELISTGSFLQPTKIDIESKKSNFFMVFLFNDISSVYVVDRYGDDITDSDVFR